MEASRRVEDVWLSREEWYYEVRKDVTWHLGDRYFWLFSCTGNLIIFSSYWIEPFEVESALIEYEAVLELVVVSSKDVERGQVMRTVIILSEKFQELWGVPAQSYSVTARTFGWWQTVWTMGVYNEEQIQDGSSNVEGSAEQETVIVRYLLVCGEQE